MVRVLFKLGAFMPRMRPGDLRDRSDLTLPKFHEALVLARGSTWEFPTFENIETFVNRLVRAGLIVTDPVVEAAIRGGPQDIAPRTEQRRVMQVTGLTRTAIHQIWRARQSARLLQAGTPIMDVVFRSGYYDQAHLSHSMRRYIGLSPARIAQGAVQLSLLYIRVRILAT